LADVPRTLPDATGLLSAMRSGAESAERVVGEHLARLRRCQPGLNAAVEILAEEAMAEARSPRPGPLSGLPVSVKETFAMAGRQITAGSLRMPPIACGRDAEAVARLRAAGAIVVARGNVPELAMAGETDNPRYGRTGNPLAPGRTCGGSSGGDGALVAAGGVAAALGTDILGSIRIPASFCGIVGFKPASGAVSKRDCWPRLGERFTDSWLAAGPLARSVRDIRLLYDVLARQPAAAPAGLRHLRLVLPRDFPFASRDPAIGEALAIARDALLAAGLRPAPVGPWPVAVWHRAMTRYLAYELLPLLADALTDATGQGLSVWRETCRQLAGRGEIYPGLHRLLLVARLVRFRRAPAAAAARRIIEEARAQVRTELGRDGLLLFPTVGVLAPAYGRMNRLTMRPGVNRLLTPLTLCNYLDLPAITLPARRCRDPRTGLVPGVMVVSAPGAEGALLDVARSLEAALATPGDHAAA
jgi:Asp-tRNA(Asn)/Glu-tRNA(Gln) amidotransferase A subunit family amidase